MNQWVLPNGYGTSPIDGESQEAGERIIADGGHESGQEEDETGTEHEKTENGDKEARTDGETKNASDPGDETDAEADTPSSGSHGNVEITEPGETEPVDPKWEPPDIENVEDIPAVTGPKTRPADASRTDSPVDEERAASSQAAADVDDSGNQEDPTAGMPNTARSPAQSRLKEGGADGYVVALELCARLSEDIRLPEEAADLVPVALEAELEENVRQFAGDQFDNPSPHVETLDFVEADDEIWLRLRLGIPPEAFADLDPDEIREHALQELEGMF
jgi:hypothetical protein